MLVLTVSQPTKETMGVLQLRGVVGCNIVRGCVRCPYAMAMLVLFPGRISGTVKE
jgi:hypothetical protein